jgi:hypothetical protein
VVAVTPAGSVRRRAITADGSAAEIVQVAVREKIAFSLSRAVSSSRGMSVA